MRQLMREMVVDNFAGGGGASTGIELAIGRSVDVAINHDPAAIAMHKANHPDTEHYCESVWDVDPREVTKGQPVALCWLSPDCKHFSKAKGGKPREKGIRGLAWVAVRWAATVRPRVIMLENVEEFKTWGPLLKDGMPDPDKKGRTFQAFINALKRQGYDVDYRELRACDYGAPTIRKRFFLIARCDGRPIIWPKPTHGDPNSIEVKQKKLKPWVPAADVIDWSLECMSIFERRKPLAENTMRRIARGIHKFVINNSDPFVIKVNHQGEAFRGQQISEPLQTITAKNGWGVVTPYVARIGQTGFGGDRLSYEMDKPLTTITTKAEHLLVTPFLAKNYGGNYNGPGADVLDPLPTVTTKDHHSLVAAFLAQYHSETASHDARGQVLDKPILTLDTSNRYSLVAAHLARHFGESIGSDVEQPVGTITAGGGGKTSLVTSHLVKMKGTNIGQPVTEPIQTITAGGLHFGEVRAFLMKYYGTGEGQELTDPLHTIPTKDRFGLVTIHGQDYVIVDIGMRMLEPHELFAAQGFPKEYIIDRDADGKSYPKSAQVARCGNSVPPPFAKYLVQANLPELCKEISYGSEHQLELQLV
ncbi:DNA (cytosine-5)-methyltransferase 1 [Paenibacillus cellulosilyticus]|uniref:DNA (cytosine-5-)-methyltransferase n=2 Tax=Paenibacillus cellulosilyticus TaxID=375489 RepID=A0A2V2Z629_9BACL|nr:DNA cytosine methyltransferase [Paenibacillus cellulosilyticus]PWW06300.1 DNA (cytosine-5)-methyltransferase 1 [Paenibacillus cellulosilyticus]